LSDYSTMIDFFDEYILHYKELLAFENQKLELIVANNVTELSNCLSKEQALIMKGNSLEKKRISLMNEQGLSDIKFGEIIDNSPKEFSTRLKSSYSELSKYVNEVKRINTNAMEIVNGKLSAVESKLSKTNNDTYDVKGGKKRESNSTSALTKNI